MRPRSVLSLLAVLLLALLVPATAHAAAGASAAFTKPSDWGSGWEGRFTLTNGTSTAINGWRVEFDLPAGTSVGSYWDALLTKDGRHNTFADRGYNAAIPAGGSVTFGFLGNGPGSPQNCTFNGEPCTGGPTDPGGLGAPGTPTVTGRTDTSLTLKWEPAAGTPSGYRVYEGSAVKATVTGTTATIGGLAKCETHTYTVKAYDADGESAASDAATATTSGCATGPLPRHFLTGYWHDFVNPAQELKLSQVPDDYDLIAVAFGESTTRPGEVAFRVDPELSTALGGYTDAQFTSDIAALQARGKKVILSVGGERGAIRVSDGTSAQLFADSVYGLMTEYGFDGVDMQYYNSGAMLGCDQKVYGQGTVDFMTALACIQLEGGLRPDQVALGLPAGPGAAGGGVVAPSVVDNALDCLAKGTGCGTFKPSRTYPDIRGAMTWSINWDVTNGGGFASTVGPHLDTLP
ncbi:cellulose binding domain-containing protein [Actinomadura latina]|uniref:cellulose binding domain-containing protein n=1 Tax=Actinomadura latina TaxID=163603 RepID=UPI0008377803|nr:cellulose binding domain-containing protein [Actinomadura latina]